MFKHALYIVFVDVCGYGCYDSCAGKGTWGGTYNNVCLDTKCSISCYYLCFVSPIYGIILHNLRLLKLSILIGFSLVNMKLTHGTFLHIPTSMVANRNCLSVNIAWSICDWRKHSDITWLVEFYSCFLLMIIVINASFFGESSLASGQQENFI